MKKSTWIIIGIAVALGIIYALTKKDTISVGVKRLELPTFEKSKVDAIEIVGQEKILLRKEGDTWKLQIGEGEKAHLVDANKAFIEQMLDAMAKISHAYYVSENPEKHEELGVKGDKTTTITLKANKVPVWALILGKNGTDNARYARLPDSNNVFAARGSFFAFTANNLSDLRDRNLWDVNGSKVTAFTVQRPKQSVFTLSKDEQGGWTIKQAEPALSPSFRLDSEAAASFVRAHLNQRALDFVDKKMELSNPLLTITAETKDHKAETLQIFAGDENSYWAKNTGKTQIFSIAKNNFDRINKSLGELRDFRIMNFDKNDISKIKLADAKVPVLLEKSDNAWEIIEPKMPPASFVFEPITIDSLLSLIAGLHGNRLADPSKDKALKLNWQKTSLLELADEKGNVIHVYASRMKQNPADYLVIGNVDREIYVVKNSRLKILEKGLDAFKKEEFILPPSQGHDQGFESLPIDVQRKLLEQAGQR